MKFHKNTLGGSQVISCGRTDNRTDRQMDRQADRQAER